jgi:membrane-associated phospholipid phosphatase
VPLSLQGKTSILIQIFVFTFIMPAAASSMLFVSGSLKSLIYQSRQERTIPLLISALIYSGASWVYVYVLKADRIISLTLLSITLCVFLGVMGNKFFKISLHSIGIGGALGYFLAIQNHYPQPEFIYPFVVIVLLSGLGIWSRLVLEAHNQQEVYVGLLIGLLGGSAPIMLLL